jgi:hypothetical protein
VWCTQQLELDSHHEVSLAARVLVEQVVGVEQVARNQSSSDCFSIDAGVDHLVFAHAEAEVLQRAL